ncbi:MAG: alpha/beta fold hydrolase [Gemmatimonadaceae bacterium]
MSARGRLGKPARRVVPRAWWSLLALAIWTAPVAAQLQRTPARSVTRHVARIAGAPVAYTAFVEEHLLGDAPGEVDASLVTIAYVRDSVADVDNRPVIFLFNGGPGASSSPLHLNGVGPRVVAGDTLADNDDSLLDVADLVFIDPVGTGFSRPVTTEAGKRRYWTRSGDARSVADVIAAWLRAHSRTESPRYLMGESYGTVRAAAILQLHRALRFDGVMLVATVSRDSVGSTTNDAYIGVLPTMATSAWYWEKIDRAGRSVDAVYAEASAFARGDYALALGAGAALGADERARVAERVAALTGLPHALVMRRSLRLSNEDWMQHILADRELRTGMLDTRVTSKRDTTRTGGLNDPALNGGTLRIGTAMLAPALVPGTPEAAAAQRDRSQMPRVERYIREELGFQTIEQYRALNLDINAVWKYEEGLGVVGPVAEAMRRDRGLRVLWANGLYDLTTPAFAAERAWERAGAPGGRVTKVLVPGPHGVFGDAESRAVVVARVRRWFAAGAR